jgi:hypothetical protein
MIASANQRFGMNLASPKKYSAHDAAGVPLDGY